MTRLEVIRALLDRKPVLSNLGRTTYDLFRGGRPGRELLHVGSHGLVSGVGLGLALARPDLTVVVLEGDGSLLMSLGTLATIAACRPPNLVLIVCDNRAYETTGGQPTHTSTSAHLASLGRGAGLSAVEEADTLDRFTAAVRRSLREKGPWMIGGRGGALGVAGPGPPPPGLPQGPVHGRPGLRPLAGRAGAPRATSRPARG